MLKMTLAQLSEFYDCLAEQVSRLVDTLPKDEQINTLISLQDALTGEPRTMQAAILAYWLNDHSAAPQLEICHA